MTRLLSGLVIVGGSALLWAVLFALFDAVRGVDVAVL